MPLYLPGLPDGNSTRIHKRKCKEPVKNGTAPLKNGTAPHHLALQGASPQGEALTQVKASHFCRKNEGTEFFQARGRHAKTSSVGRSRQLPRRGSRERGLSIKRLFDEKMPDCCSAAPHHLALQGASPQGEAAKRQYENLSSIVCLRRHFPRYRRFFRAFLSQEKKRKRGKQG